MDIEIEHKDGLLWTPIRTKPRREKKLQEFCLGKGIACYLPLKKSIKRYERKTVEFFPPMFPSYAFCHLDHELFKVLLTSHLVVFRVKVTEQLEKGLIEDLRSIRIMENASATAEILVKPEIVPGAPVRVASGPLRGVLGVVERRLSQITITVNVELLGQSVSVKLDVGDVETVD